MYRWRDYKFVRSRARALIRNYTSRDFEILGNPAVERSSARRRPDVRRVRSLRLNGFPSRDRLFVGVVALIRPTTRLIAVY